MKNFCLLVILLIATSIHTTVDAQTDNWYNKKEWLQGLALQPHESINKTEFEKQYQLHKAYWDTAFAFLKNNDLKNMPAGRYAIDGDNVYAVITENPTKDMDSAKWESHKKYIDLHHVITGDEKIGEERLSALSITMLYNSTKDLINYTGNGTFYTATPNNFFLFFPSDAHKPNVTTGGNKADKKIVIKIRYATETK